MKTVKLSTLPLEAKLMREDCNMVFSVEEMLDDPKYYAGKKIYTAVQYNASFDAEDVFRSAFENECENMYENWDEAIADDVTSEDIADMQKIFDRILERRPGNHIAYQTVALVEIDAELEKTK